MRVHAIQGAQEAQRLDALEVADPVVQAARGGLADQDRVAARLVAGLREKGYEVVGPQASGPRSPIISIAVRSDEERERIQRGLGESKTTCAVRESRVRLSPHFYNTDEEIDRLLSCL